MDALHLELPHDHVGDFAHGLGNVGSRGERNRDARNQVVGSLGARKGNAKLRIALERIGEGAEAHNQFFRRNIFVERGAGEDHHDALQSRHVVELPDGVVEERRFGHAEAKSPAAAHREERREFSAPAGLKNGFARELRGFAFVCSKPEESEGALQGRLFSARRAHGEENQAEAGGNVGAVFFVERVVDPGHVDRLEGRDEVALRAHHLAEKPLRLSCIDEGAMVDGHQMLIDLNLRDRFIEIFFQKKRLQLCGILAREVFRGERLIFKPVGEKARGVEGRYRPVLAFCSDNLVVKFGKARLFNKFSDLARVLRADFLELRIENFAEGHGVFGIETAEGAQIAFAVGAGGIAADEGKNLAQTRGERAR